MNMIRTLLGLSEDVLLSPKQVTLAGQPVAGAGSYAFSSARSDLPNEALSPSFSERLASPVFVLQDDHCPWRLQVAGGDLIAGSGVAEQEGWWEVDTRPGPAMLIGHDEEGPWALELHATHLELCRLPREETPPLILPPAPPVPVLPALRLPEWKTDAPAWLRDSLEPLLTLPDLYAQLRGAGRLFRLYTPRGRAAAIGWGAAFQEIARTLSPEVREAVVRVAARESERIMEDLPGCGEPEVAVALLLARDDLQSLTLLRQAHEPDGDLQQMLKEVDREMSTWRTALLTGARSAPEPIRERLNRVAVCSPEEPWGLLL